jgi:signal transduction histidine kinase/CheY-like chemotaxis protein
MTACNWRPGVRKELRIAGISSPPFLVIDSAGKFSGPTYELIERAAQRASIRLTWLTSKTQLLKELGPLYDAATSVPKLPPYLGQIYFSRPWLVTDFIVLSLRKNQEKIAQRTGQLKMGFLQVGVRPELILKVFPNAELIRNRLAKQSLAEVCAGRLDAMLATSRTAQSLLLERPIECGAEAIDWTLLPEGRFEVSMVAAPGFERSVDAIRAELGPMAREGEISRIYAAHPAAGSDVAMFLTLGELEDEDRKVRASSVLFAGLALASLVGLYLVARGRMRAERQSREARAASQAKSDFVATVSHELRTPVHGFLGMTTLLLESPLNPAQREMANAALESAKHLHLLLDDVLDLAKIEAGKLEIVKAPLGLRRLMEQCAASLRVTLRDKPVQLCLSGMEQCPEWVLGDEKCLRQVLINLGSNAVKFTDAGEIVLGVSVALEDEKGWVLDFLISDTGIGIPADQLPRLFGRFEQVQGPRQEGASGTGLGLAIVRQLLALMGSEIGVSSAVGQGTRFQFRLRMERAAAVVSVEPAAVARQLRGRVLVMEDNRVNQRVISGFLQRLGLEFDVAGDGEEGLAVHARGGHSLILMDCQMPGVDGLEATRRIRILENSAGAGRRVPIVALTANTTAEDRERCRMAGMDDFLGKPFRLETLTEMLEKWLPEESGRGK